MGGQASVSAVAGALEAVETRRRFHHVDTWIFDLDNTLYPASCNLFAEVDQRMGAYIAKAIGVPFEHARHEGVEIGLTGERGKAQYERGQGRQQA